MYVIAFLRRVRALCELSKRDRYAHACVCACSRWLDVCAAELVSLPIRTSPVCMCVCVCVRVEYGTPGRGWVGAERDRDMFYRDAPGSQKHPYHL